MTGLCGFNVVTTVAGSAQQLFWFMRQPVCGDDLSTFKARLTDPKHSRPADAARDL